MSIPLWSWHSDISSAQPQCINTSELRRLRLTGGRRLAPATTAPLPALLRFALCFDVSCLGTHLEHNFLNNSSNKEREICGKWLLAQLTMNLHRRYTLCIQNFITDRTSQSAGAEIRASIFNRCNESTVRTRGVPLVHKTCDVITLSHGCAKVAHCVPVQWRNFSHYCRPIRQYDVFWAQRSTDRRAESRRCTHTSD